MRIINRNEMAKTVHERYVTYYGLTKERYHWTPEEIHEKRRDRARRIHALGPNPNPDEVEKIILEGLDRKTTMFLTVPTCRACDKQCDEVIELPNSDIGATEKGKYYICSECLRQALITLDKGIV